LSGWGLQPVEVERLPERVYDYRIDINQATWVEWMQLPGVGETLAKRILEYREENGPFQSVDELDDIKGIGPKTLEKLRPWLMVQEQTAE
jgi:competence protein ComEA